jgi:hypothetical protein
MLKDYQFAAVELLTQMKKHPKLCSSESFPTGAKLPKKHVSDFCKQLNGTYLQ